MPRFCLELSIPHSFNTNPVALLIAIRHVFIKWPSLKAASAVLNIQGSNGVKAVLWKSLGFTNPDSLPEKTYPQPVGCIFTPKIDGPYSTIYSPGAPHGSVRLLPLGLS